MNESDMHYEQHITLDVDATTQNLAGNFHLKWSYGLLFVDKYSDEQGLPTSIISGIRREDDSTHYIRVYLKEEQKGTSIKIDLWKVTTAGWPFPSMSISSSGSNNKLVDIVDDVMQFCQTPFENTGGVMPMLKNMFSGKAETRKERD